jgi:hypothetical protein
MGFTRGTPLLVRREVSAAEVAEYGVPLPAVGKRRHVPPDQAVLARRSGWGRRQRRPRRFIPDRTTDRRATLLVLSPNGGRILTCDGHPAARLADDFRHDHTVLRFLLLHSLHRTLERAS